MVGLLYYPYICQDWCNLMMGWLAVDGMIPCHPLSHTRKWGIVCCAFNITVLPSFYILGHCCYKAEPRGNTLAALYMVALLLYVLHIFQY